MGFLTDLGSRLVGVGKYTAEYQYWSDTQLMDEYKNLNNKYGKGEESTCRRTAISSLLDKRGYKSDWSGNWRRK